MLLQKCVGGRVNICVQVFGDHNTVRVKGLLENIKWVWGPYRRCSNHPDENQDTLTAIRFHGVT